MKNSIRYAVLISAMVFFVQGTAFAIPLLQLDIANGTYNTATQTIIAPSSDPNHFTLYAYLLPNGNRLTDTYYVSASLSPNPGQTGGNYGSFSYRINGTGPMTSVDVTSGMIYGVPPLEANVTQDPHDLPTHGVFPTYFREIQFQFSTSQKSDQYNTQDNPGWGPHGTGGANPMYWVSFEFDITGLQNPYLLHFDLYNEVCKSTDCDVEKFAPFSHDAQSQTSQPVPEPSSVLLFGLAAAGFGISRRRRAE